jgi:exodeoxyribonuclease-3
VLALCDRIVASGRHVVVAGDFNIAHKPIDLANPRSNEGNPGYLPEERAWMDRYVAAGYADSLRRFDDGPERYTWWTYRVPSARERNIGWRLDYHCADEGLMKEVRGASIHPAVMGSDHCPVSVDIDVDI